MLSSDSLRIHTPVITNLKSNFQLLRKASGEDLAGEVKNKDVVTMIKARQLTPDLNAGDSSVYQKAI
jgi:hypothetical protein